MSGYLRGISGLSAPSALELYGRPAESYFLSVDSSPLPFLARALRRHLEEFPGVRNGLSRTEETILGQLDSGSRAIADVFRSVDRGEEAFYIADASFWTVLRRLARPPAPAVELKLDEDGARFLPRGFVRITDLGRALVAGAEDWVRLNGINRWIGGVHLRGEESPWRWDAADGRLVRASDRTA